MLTFRGSFAVIGVALALATTGVYAELKEGRDYETLAEQQPTDAKGKIEVIEFFWYGCPHCYRLEPVLSKWLPKLPADVAFHRVHADFGRWTKSARLFYALEALGEEMRVRSALFDAIHNERLDYTNESVVAEWLARKGVDRDRFTEAYNSPAVEGKAQRAEQLSESYGLVGVPAVVVGGKYRTSVSQAGGYDELPGVVDELIVKTRYEQAGTR